MTDHDPRWEWVEVTSFGGPPEYVRGRCLHVDVVPVISSGVTVAHLCLTCDAQLPEECPSMCQSVCQGLPDSIDVPLYLLVMVVGRAGLEPATQGL